MEISEETTNVPVGQRVLVDHRVSADQRGAIITPGQRLDRVCQNAQAAWISSRYALKDINLALDLNGRTKRKPYSMMTAAVGAGYVLGGGTFSPLTARIVGAGLRLGLRLAAVPYIKRELLGIAEAVGRRSEDSSDAHENAQDVKIVNDGKTTQ